MSTINIKFSDGNKFEEYYDDSYYIHGCETCDYGSSYINEIAIYTTNYEIEIKLDQMYEYAFSIADTIKIFAIDMHNISEIEFVDYLKNQFETYRNKVDDFSFTVTNRN